MTTAVTFEGLQPFGPGGLYEFTLGDQGPARGSIVHLHDGHCRRIVHELTTARLVLDVAFDPEWAPDGHPDGCVVRMTFEDAAVESWQHQPGPAEHAGQCSGLDRHRGNHFTLELLNDLVVFTAGHVSVQVFDPVPAPAGSE